MAVFLFDKIIFGPVKSRRLGVSLGINLLPLDSKFCNFNCIYCECGWTPKLKTVNKPFHSVEKVHEALQLKFKAMKAQNIPPDVITFAGNGEPTLHPKFAEVIDATIGLRDFWFPKAKIAVLSNATTLHNKSKLEALQRIDMNIQKLDSLFKETVELINKPLFSYSIPKVVKQLAHLNTNVIVQTMFVRGTYNGQTVDNATETELNAWIEAIRQIKPREVMIYTIARDTPIDTLVKVPKTELDAIAARLEALGFPVQVSA